EAVAARADDRRVVAAESSWRPTLNHNCITLGQRCSRLGEGTRHLPRTSKGDVQTGGVATAGRLAEGEPNQIGHEPRSGWWRIRTVRNCGEVQNERRRGLVAARLPGLRRKEAAAD